MAERYSSFDRRGWRWFLQRLTAAFLIIVLAFHFMLLHFVNHAETITFMGSTARMSQVGYLITMVLFLVTATFHGVNGVHNALVNQGLDGTQGKVVLGLLVIAGAALIVQGIRVALAMTGMA